MRALLVFVLASAGCATVLGIDGDYQLDGGGASSSSTGDGSVDGTAGNDGSTPGSDSSNPNPNPNPNPSCEPLPSTSAGSIDDACAIFVAPSGEDTNAGTKAAPVKTIAQGIQKAIALSKRVYVCDAAYSAKVIVPQAVSIFGGFACPTPQANFPTGAAWSYVAASRPIVTGTAGEPGLLVKDVTGDVRIEDMAFVAGATTEAAPSSIAAIAAGSQRVALVRVFLTAGDARNGRSLGDSAAAALPAPTAGSGAPVGGGVVTHAPSHTCTCNTGGTTTGGGGGGANCAAGLNGEPAYTPSDPAANTGAGATFPCNSGLQGSNGRTGTEGAAATSGSITGEAYVPRNGTPGSNGTPGQGGGGSECAGGSGGCGGCGGGGGPAGSGGGASAGLLVRSTVVELTACSITTGKGGNGGAGINGAAGAAGANGGANNSGCQPGTSGGKGGTGGRGGHGGGGAGGPAACIMTKQGTTAPAVDGPTNAQCTHGTAGTAGGGPIPGPAGAVGTLVTLP